MRTNSVVPLIGYSLDDVLLLPKHSSIKSRLDTNTRTRLTSGISIDIPIMSTNMSTVTEYDMANAMSSLGGIGAVHRFLPVDEQSAIVYKLAQKHDNVMASIGVGLGEQKRAHRLIDAGANIILIDVAHAHTDSVAATLGELYQDTEDIQYVVGNIATYEAAKYILGFHPDGLRVGIGGGSRCTTRTVTGHGVPNLTALVDVVQARDEYLKETGKYVPVIIDGGIKNSGDIVKSLYFGADVACLGNLLAGTTEAPGEIIETEQGTFKKYYGMASKEAQDNHRNGLKEGTSAEGFSELVKYKGPVEPIINNLVGGIRSGLTYSGASNINELRDKGEAIQLSNASRAESKL